MKRVISFLSAFLIAGVAGAVETRKEPRWRRFFESRKLTGTMVVRDEAKGVMHVSNPKRAETPFSPTSTFKIPDALTALDVKVVRNPDEVIPYGRTKEFMKEWEREMFLLHPVLHTISRYPFMRFAVHVSRSTAIMP